MSIDADTLRDLLACSLTPSERDAFTAMLHRLERDERARLSARQLQWALEALRKHRPQRADTTPAVLRNLPMRPPGRARA